MNSIKIEQFRKTYKLSYKELYKFTKQLASLIDSGIEVYDALSFIKNNTKNRRSIIMIDDINIQLLKGMTFSESLFLYKKCFSMFYYEMIHLGETTSTLGIVLKELSAYLERNHRHQKKITSALIYPKILLFITILISFVISFYILPLFNDIFTQNEFCLPKITQIFFEFSNFLRKNLLLLGIGVILLIIISYFVCKINKVQYYIDYLKLHFPLISAINLNEICLEFTSSYSILAANGINAIDNIQMLIRISPNLIIKKKLETTINNLQKGYELNEALRNAKIYPDELIEMLATGERSGRLIPILRKMTIEYDDHLNETIDRLAKLLEPIMILFVAIIVIVLLMTVFLPMLNIIKGFNITL